MSQNQFNSGQWTLGRHTEECERACYMLIVDCIVVVGSARPHSQDTRGVVYDLMSEWNELFCSTAYIV